MRKTLIGCLFALLVLGLVAAPASAVTLTPGEKVVKIRDNSNLFVESDPNHDGLDPVGLLGPAGLVQWAEQRTIFQVTTIFDDGGNVEFDTSANEELSGMLYELELAQIVQLSPTNFVLDFAPMGVGAGSPNAARNPIVGDFNGDTLAPGAGPTGGALEVYVDSNKDYTSDPGGVGRYDAKLPAPAPVLQDPGNGPSLWTEGQGAGIRDQFPTISDGSASLWLSAVLIDLNYLVAQGVVATPAVPFAPGTVMREEIEFAAGTGQGFAYANVVGGSYASSIDTGLIADYVDLALLFDLNTPIYDAATNEMRDTLVYNGLGQWTVDSQDPVVFGVIPEPMTASLLGLGLLGLVARRKRS